MMNLQHALDVVAKLRGDRVVITTMSAISLWPKLSDTPLDFNYIPSAMGHAPGLGLGLALAQPGRGVIVLNGDGCTLMNLGCLVTLANHPADVYLLIIDNGHYEVTGGQPTAGTGHTNFADLARGAGVQRVYAFDSAEAWAAHAAEALSGPGPVVVWLKVEGKVGQKTPAPPRPMAEQIQRLREGLRV